jgi:hypothetical protein
MRGGVKPLLTIRRILVCWGGSVAAMVLGGGHLGHVDGDPRGQRHQAFDDLGFDLGVRLRRVTLVGVGTRGEDDGIRLHGLDVVESRDHPDVRTGSINGEPLTQLGIDRGQPFGRPGLERFEPEVTSGDRQCFSRCLATRKLQAYVLIRRLPSAVLVTLALISPFGGRPAAREIAHGLECAFAARF